MIFILLGQLVCLGLHLLTRRAWRAGWSRSLAFAEARAYRVEMAHVCEGCRQRGRHGHSWFCPQGDVRFFNDHDMSHHVGIRRW